MTNSIEIAKSGSKCFVVVSCVWLNQTDAVNVSELYATDCL